MIFDRIKEIVGHTIYFLATTPYLEKAIGDKIYHSEDDIQMFRDQKRLGEMLGAKVNVYMLIFEGSVWAEPINSPQKK
jgi:hypothetical protein